MNRHERRAEQARARKHPVVILPDLNAPNVKHDHATRTITIDTRGMTFEQAAQAHVTYHLGRLEAWAGRELEAGRDPLDTHPEDAWRQINESP